MNKTFININNLASVSESRRFAMSAETASNVNAIRRRRRTSWAGCDGV